MKWWNCRRAWALLPFRWSASFRLLCTFALPKQCALWVLLGLAAFIHAYAYVEHLHFNYSSLYIFLCCCCCCMFVINFCFCAFFFPPDSFLSYSCEAHQAQNVFFRFFFLVKRFFLLSCLFATTSHICIYEMRNTNHGLTRNNFVGRKAAHTKSHPINS